MFRFSWILLNCCQLVIKALDLALRTEVENQRWIAIWSLTHENCPVIISSRQGQSRRKHVSYFCSKHFEICPEGLLQETNPLYVGRWIFLNELFTFNHLFQGVMLLLVVVGQGVWKGKWKRRRKRKRLQWCPSNYLSFYNLQSDFMC